MIGGFNNDSDLFLNGINLRISEASRIIREHRTEFEDYKQSGLKLAAVKALKEYSGYGLKESKEILDQYWEGKLQPYLKKEERKEKLERLAKAPLVEELILKMKNMDESKLKSMLMILPVDELLSIDEFLTK